MINLAGHAQATEIVTRELTRCGIPVVKSDEPIGEPMSVVFGELGSFTFKRAWYYYRVNGPTPLVVAQALYENPVGKTDIRVAGHCGCPPPEPPWTTSRDPETGKEIWAREKRAGFDNLGDDLKRDLLEQFDQKSIWGDPADGDIFVESYHIDSELGLYLFVQAVKLAALHGRRGGAR